MCCPFNIRISHCRASGHHANIPLFQVLVSGPRGVGRAELLGGGGGSKQLKIPPGVGLGRGCKISYIFLEGGGVRETPLATPLLFRF